MTTALRTVPVALLATAGWLSGCGKAAEPAPPRTPTEMLTGHKWLLVAEGSLDTTNGRITRTDASASIPACDKDDLLAFVTAPARTFAIDKGALLCTPDVSGGYRGNWDFGPNETVLVYNAGTSYSTTFKIEALTDKQLALAYKVHYVTPSPNNSKRYGTLTYEAR
jgi:hypothetical protein